MKLLTQELSDSKVTYPVALLVLKYSSNIWELLTLSKPKNENLTGAPTSAEEIANALNELTPATSHRWQAGFIDTSTPLAAFNLLLNTEQSWMGQRSEFGNRVGHMVVVDGLDRTGLVLIRDPWEGTRYKMNIDEFLQVWNQIAVF